ncbi:MAG: hypothetical protein ACJ71L_08800 [Nitrososphaeraceae archaeon]
MLRSWERYREHENGSKNKKEVHCVPVEQIQVSICFGNSSSLGSSLGSSLERNHLPSS